MLRYQSSPAMIEIHAHRASFDDCLTIKGARVLDVFAISESTRCKSEAMANILLIGRMHVVGIADIDGNGHSSIGNRQGSALSLADYSPIFAR